MLRNKHIKKKQPPALICAALTNSVSACNLQIKSISRSPSVSGGKNPGQLLSWFITDAYNKHFKGTSYISRNLSLNYLGLWNSLDTVGYL